MPSMILRGDLPPKPQDHYSPLPNVVWGLGLNACELATYMYLMYRENRKTYRCHPSYEEIGSAIGRNKRSVPKYVAGLVEKRLVEVEPTTLTLKDGTKCNGTLEYHLLNPQIAVRHYNENYAARAAAKSKKRGTTLEAPVSNVNAAVSDFADNVGTEHDLLV